MHHRWKLIVSVEHARNDVPPEIDLGLDAEVLDSHVAWDPGALDVGRIVAQATGAPLFEGRWTRLVADLNRSPGNPDVVPEVAFGVPVPGNQGMTVADRQARIDRYHTPYWTDVRQAVRDAMADDPDACVFHLSVHSFTGEFQGQVREMSMGVMLDPGRILERYVADHLLDALVARGVNAVENQPYDGRADAIVTAFRPEMGDRSYAGIEVEVSQNHLDEIGDLGRRLLEAVRWLIDTH